MKLLSFDNKFGLSKYFEIIFPSEVCAMYGGVINRLVILIWEMRKLLKMKKQVKMIKLMKVRFRTVPGSWEN